jgi:cobalt-precorrin-5B (C1)-methyltransferase
VFTHEIEFACDRVGPTGEQQLHTCGQGRFRRINTPHEKPEIRVRESREPLSPGGKKGPGTDGGQEGGGVIETGDPPPVVTVAGSPAGSAQQEQRHPGDLRRESGRATDPLSKGMGGVDHGIDVLFSQPFSHALWPAEPPDPHLTSGQPRLPHPPGKRGDDPSPRPGDEAGGKFARLPGPAENHHTRPWHAGSVSETLRRGWTTGACATAATKAAVTALLTGEFPDPVQITLPKGHTPAFALTQTALTGTTAMAAIVKDAGDDPDVTHGATIRSTVRHGTPGTGITFRAGPGVGTVTKPGLPLPVGEPAINPVPRQLIRQVIAETGATDIVVEISVDNGEELARRTWNPRLGILGGLSILGTTGIVVPYSCSAWIDSIRRGVDVARAAGHRHVAACTGSTSEKAVTELYGLPDDALLDMGDFAGAVLKYLRRHPVPRLTIAGGFAKLSKLADGHLDLHSGRSQVDLASLARRTRNKELADSITKANTALEALQLAQAAEDPLADAVAEAARTTAQDILKDAPVQVDVLVIDRTGRLVGHAPRNTGDCPGTPTP